MQKVEFWILFSLAIIALGYGLYDAAAWTMQAKSRKSKPDALTTTALATIASGKTVDDLTDDPKKQVRGDKAMAASMQPGLRQFASPLSAVILVYVVVSLYRLKPGK